MVKALGAHGYYKHDLKLELDLKNHESLPTWPSIEEPPVLELMVLLAHLRYVVLGTYNSLYINISANLNDEQIEALVSILKQFKEAIRWTFANIIGIPPIYTLTRFN